MTVGRRGIILAAGKGTRMGALSETLPKPLTSVNGKTLLSRLREHFQTASCDKVIVNVHHLADQIEAYLEADIKAGFVEVSDERDALLETGGGVKKALPRLGADPFFVGNGDALWVDNGRSNLMRLKEAWDADVMDVLLLLVKKEAALGYDGVGDFFGSSDGVNTVQSLRFRGNADSAAYVFGGVQIIQPALYDDTPEGPWSNREVFKKAAARGRLYGLEIDGHWMHVGTADAIADAEEKLVALGLE